MPELIAPPMRQWEGLVPLADAGQVARDAGDPVGHQMHHLALALDAAVNRDHAGGEDHPPELLEELLPDHEFLRQHFGKSGDWYYRISRGIDHRPVEPHRERRSIGAEDTFFEDIFSFDPAKEEIEALAAKVWRSCEAKELTGRTVTLKVRYADFQRITRSRTIERGVRDAAELASNTSVLLESLFPIEKGIRMLGVTLLPMEPQGYDGEEQLSIGLPGL